MYAYYDGFTSAQVELLTMDSPMVDYDTKKKGKSKKTPPKPTMAEADAASERWKEKYEGKSKKVKLDLTRYK